MDRREFVQGVGAAVGMTLLGTSASGRTWSFNRTSRPSILFIMTDQQSVDAMSWRLGSKYLDTPAMDDLASKGTIFTHAYTANPLCVPCRTSIFTGFYPHQTQVETNSDINKPLAGKVKHMGTMFKEAGYDTGYVGKWHMAFPAKDPSAHGFDFMRSIKNNGIDQEIPGGAEEFLSIKREKPFLLVTSFVNPHNICEWARNDKLPDGELGMPPALDQCPPAVGNLMPMHDEADVIPLIRKSYQNNRLFPVGNFNEKKWREYRWAYYRLIERVDGLIGNVIQSLKDSGHYEDTVIVFTSDHGDMQGAHGWNQKTVLFEEAIRVPFIISEPEKRNKTMNVGLVNTGVDILPTLCDYAGITLPANYPGVSVKDGKKDREYIVVENKMIQGDPVDGVKPEPSGRMVRSKRFKYSIYDMGKRNESLVDVENDPGETVNLAEKTEYRQELERHRQFLAEWKRSTKDSFVVPE